MTIQEYSVKTISQAGVKWKNFSMGTWQFTNVKKEDNKSLTVSGSNMQSYLEGCVFKVSNDTWIGGHITLSPEPGSTGHCSSAHLTLTGGSSWAGNYFYDIDESGAYPGSAPKKFKGQHSKSANSLPVHLRKEVENVLDALLTF